VIEVLKKVVVRLDYNAKHSKVKVAIPRMRTQLFRYGMVGATSNLVGYCLFWLVAYFGVEPKMAMTILYFVGATIGYFGNRQWAFSHEGSLLRSGWRYFLAHTLGYSLNFLILLTYVDVLGYPYQVVQAAAVVVVAIFLFFTFRYFVFPKTRVRSRGDD
jgi:putative flippase GtrA